MCRKARTRWVGVAGKIENACVRTAHTLHPGYGLLYGCEPISDDPKVGWVAKPNVFRQLSSLCWVFNSTYACYMRATACLIPTATPSSLPWERVRERATSRKACIWGCEGVGKDCRNFGRYPLPSPPPQGREWVATGSSVAGRLKKECPKYQ